MFLRHKIVLLFQALCLPVVLEAQSLVKISGVVTDSTSGQPLMGANVVVAGYGIGTVTDFQGRFVLDNLLVGTYSIQVSYMGYRTQTRHHVRVTRDHEVRLHFRLIPTILSLPAVEIQSESQAGSLSSPAMIISREEILAHNYRFIQEALQNLPGVEIDNPGSSSNKNKISIRGSQGNQVLVLFDRMPLNDQFTGEVDLSSIPLSLVEKIEVFKGGQSTRFGNGAVGGVVNIVSRRHSQKQIELEGAVGSYRAGSLQALLSKSIARWQFVTSFQVLGNAGDFPYHYVTGDGLRIEERRANSDIHSNNGFARITYQWGGHHFSLQAQRFVSERGLPGKIYFWTGYARANRNQTSLQSRYHFETDHVCFHVDHGWSQTREEYANLWPANAPLRDRRYPRYHYENEVTLHRIHGEAQVRAPLNLYSHLGFGIQNLRFRDRDLLYPRHIPIGQARDRTLDFFFLQEWRGTFLHPNIRFILETGIRFDRLRIQNGHHRREETQWSPAVSSKLTFHAPLTLSARFSSGRSFRAPTFADLFYQDVRIQGKPDLLPEKGMNTEWGLLLEGASTLPFRAEITFFRNLITDLITWRLGSFETYSPYNVDAQITGAEYLVEVAAPSQWVQFHLGYTNLNPRNREHRRTVFNKILPYRAQHSLKTAIRLKWRRWDAGLQLRYSGKRYVTESNTVEMPPYKIVDLHINRQVEVKRAMVFLRFSCFNLLNTEYQILEGMPLPRRELRFGIQIQK